MNNYNFILAQTGLAKKKTGKPAVVPQKSAKANVPKVASLQPVEKRSLSAISPLVNNAIASKVKEDPSALDPVKTRNSYAAAVSQNYVPRYKVETDALMNDFMAQDIVAPVKDKGLQIKSVVSDLGKKAKVFYDENMEGYKIKKNFLGDSLVLGNNLLAATEPLAPSYRPQVDVKIAKQSSIDPQAAIAKIDSDYRLLTDNAPSATAGMAYRANIAGKLADSKADVIQQANVANKQIADANAAAVVNAANATASQQMQINAQARDEYLQADDARKKGISNVLNSFNNSVAKQITEDNNLKVSLINTPYLKKSMFGNIKFDKKEYLDFVVQTEDAKDVEDKKEKLKKAKAASLKKEKEDLEKED